MLRTTIAATLFLLFLTGYSNTSFAVPSGEVIMWHGGGRGAVTFEGTKHSKGELRCDSCHPVLFKMKAGSARITMDSMKKGQFCGACHNGNTTFSTSDPEKCNECHKGPQGKEEKRAQRKKHTRRHKG